MQEITQNVAHKKWKLKWGLIGQGSHGGRYHDCNHLPEPWPLSEPTSPWSGEHFYSNADRPKLAAACHRSVGAVHPPHAQVPRHPPDTHRPLYAHGCDALAPGPATARAGGQRQNCPLHCLRRTGLPTGPHGPIWPDACHLWR